MVKKFILSEKEKSRISNMHTQKILLERGFENLNQSITEQEQAVQYYKDETGKVIKLVGNQSPPLGSTPATPEEYAAQNPTITVTPPQGQPTTTGVTRFSTAVCPGKDTGRLRCVDRVLKIQVRMNDECPADILNSILTKYPKAATGTAGSLKLKEDGSLGSGTKASFAACKEKLKPTKVAGGGGTTTTSGSTTTQGTTVAQGPKIGEPFTANDIATLTAA